MMILKADTAVTLKIGPFIDDTDGKTAETGLTITQAEVRISKNGANIIQKNEGANCTADELGVYGCPIDGTDTDTDLCNQGSSLQAENLQNVSSCKTGCRHNRNRSGAVMNGLTKRLISKQCW